MNYSHLSLIAENTTRSKDLEANRELVLKIKGINGYLVSLLQKRTRLDLEIRKAKKRIKKLQTEAQKAKTVRSDRQPSLFETSSKFLSFEQQEDIVFDSLDQELELAQSLLAEVAQLSLQD